MYMNEQEIQVTWVLSLWYTNIRKIKSISKITGIDKDTIRRILEYYNIRKRRVYKRIEEKKSYGNKRYD